MPTTAEKNPYQKSKSKCRVQGENNRMVITQNIEVQRPWCAFSLVWMGYECSGHTNWKDVNILKAVNVIQLFTVQSTIGTPSAPEPPAWHHNHLAIQASQSYLMFPLLNIFPLSSASQNMTYIERYRYFTCQLIYPLTNLHCGH